MLTSMGSVSVPSPCRIPEQSTSEQHQLVPRMPSEQKTLFSKTQQSVTSIFALLTLNLHPSRPSTILQLFSPCLQRDTGFRFVRDRLMLIPHGKKSIKIAKTFPTEQQRETSCLCPVLMFSYMQVNFSCFPQVDPVCLFNNFH